MEIQIRPYQEADFESVVELFDTIWGWELTGPKEERWALATFYCAGAWLKSDMVRVLTADDALAAVAFFNHDAPSQDRVVDQPSLTKPAWLLTVFQESLQVLQASTTGQETLTFYERIDAINDQLMMQARANGFSWQSELRLLMTHPRYQGKGFAKKIMFDGLQRLSEQGLAHCMLKTDTHCAYQFYDKTGWQQRAVLPWPKEDDMTAFLYGYDLSQCAQRLSAT